MGWTEPKTDWKETDRLNVEDYNRIKNNMEYLHGLGTELYPSFLIGELGDDKEITGHYYAREFNALEDCLETINEMTFPMDYGDKQVFADNGPFIDYEELNRLERAILNIYKILTAQKQGRHRLAFVLGNRKGVRI